MKAEEIAAAIGPLLNWEWGHGTHLWSDKGSPLFFFSHNRVTITSQGILYREGRAAYTIIGWCAMHGVDFVVRNPKDVELLRQQNGIGERSSALTANAGRVKVRAREIEATRLGDNIVELFPTRK